MRLAPINFSLDVNERRILESALNCYIARCELQIERLAKRRQTQKVYDNRWSQENFKARAEDLRSKIIGDL